MPIHIPSERRRGSARATRLPLIALALACVGVAAEAAAQQPSAGHRIAVGGEAPAGVTTVSPHSGPAGSVVEVRAEALPADTRVQIMVGALRSGFEVVAVTRTDGQGRLAGGDAHRISVPDWVQSDRSYVVIVTDLEYNPLAVADVFHATDARGRVVREGRIEEVAPCPALTNDAGELYFLTGGTTGMRIGDQVVVEGEVVDSEACGKATTLRVRAVRPLPTR